MELKNLNTLKDEIEYLEEAEKLLKKLYDLYEPYELYHFVRTKYKENKTFDKNLSEDIARHFDFDDSE